MTIPDPFTVCILLAFILVIAWLNNWFPHDPNDPGKPEDWR